MSADAWLGHMDPQRPIVPTPCINQLLYTRAAPADTGFTRFVKPVKPKPGAQNRLQH